MSNISLIMVNDLIELTGTTNSVFRVSHRKGNIVYSLSGDEYELDDNTYQGSWPTPEGDIIHVYSV
ncbi:MAG: hypothetical protein ACRC6V_06735 [Bacteroidales bacterium]